MLKKMNDNNVEDVRLLIYKYCIKNISRDLKIYGKTYSEVIESFNNFKDVSKLKETFESEIMKGLLLENLKNTCFISKKNKTENERLYFYANLINIFISKDGVVSIQIIKPTEKEKFYEDSHNLEYNKCLYALASIMHLIDDDLDENTNIVSFLDD
jgi:hypothetical protein